MIITLKLIFKNLEPALNDFFIIQSTFSTFLIAIRIIKCIFFDKTHFSIKNIKKCLMEMKYVFDGF